MQGFCVELIEREPALLACHGVLTATALRTTADACAAAAHIMQRARDEADALMLESRQKATQAVEQLRLETAKQATQLLETMQRTYDDFFVRTEPIVLSLAQAAFERLTGELTPHERVQAVLHRLRKEVPPRLIDAVLRLHPEDMSYATGSDWDIQPDLLLPRGTCRLEAGEGEWRVSFDVALSVLRQAFIDMLAEGAEPQH